MPESPSAVVIDAKENAGATFEGVIQSSRTNFPDARFHPTSRLTTTIEGQFDAHGYTLSNNSDGTGTKPELAERLFHETGDHRFFESLAFDASAMVVDDNARTGRFTLAVTNSLNLSSADDAKFTAALAKGQEEACRKGRFALVNGETAELGHRTPGIGKNRLNWDMTALTLTNPDKLIDGSKLKPGQVVVGLREKSIRSNGLTRARKILENAYIARHGNEGSKEAHIAAIFRKKFDSLLLDDMALSMPEDQPMRDTTDIIRDRLEVALTGERINRFLDDMFPGSNVVEQIQLPWHKEFPEETEMLLTPSTIYSPLIYEAQGGVDGAVNIPLVACAHISGGGVPLKGKRMIPKGMDVGLQLDTVFPDPAGIPRLMELAQQHPKADGSFLVNNRTATEQWNRGVGFMCVVENQQQADELIAMAACMGYEAKTMGQTTNERKIHWRGETWNI